MNHVFIINAHQPYSSTDGKLNAALVKLAEEQLQAKGYKTRVSETAKGWDTEKELANHQWADIVILQCPVHWMGVPWTFKKYSDEVYSAGTKGILCNSDGRSTDAPALNYGAGGVLTNKRYMLSLTFNAPREAFSNDKEYLFQGKDVDDLFFPVHMNFRFFGMTQIKTFACFDVVKNPDIANDFKRFENHLEQYL